MSSESKRKNHIAVKLIISLLAFVGLIYLYRIPQNYENLMEDGYLFKDIGLYIIIPVVVVFIGLLINKKIVGVIVISVAIVYSGLAYYEYSLYMLPTFETQEARGDLESEINALVHGQYSDSKLGNLISSVIDASSSDHIVENITTSQESLDFIFKRAFYEKSDNTFDILGYAHNNDYQLPFDYLCYGDLFLDYSKNDMDYLIELVNKLIDNDMISKAQYNQKFLEIFHAAKAISELHRYKEAELVYFPEALHKEDIISTQTFFASYAIGLTAMKENTKPTEQELKGFGDKSNSYIDYASDYIKDLSDVDRRVAIKSSFENNEMIIPEIMIFGSLHPAYRMEDGELLIHYLARNAKDEGTIDIIIYYPDFGDYTAHIIGGKDNAGHTLGYYALKNKSELAIKRLVDEGYTFVDISDSGTTMLDIVGTYDLDLQTNLNSYIKATILGWEIVNADHSDYSDVQKIMESEDFQNIYDELMD